MALCGVDDAFERIQKLRIVELAGDPHRLRQVGMSDPKDIDAGGGGDGVQVGKSFFALNLADDSRVLVGPSSEFDRLRRHVVR